MSRELIIEHCGTILWSCTTSFPIGEAWYQEVAQDEGPIGAEELLCVDQWLVGRTTSTQHTLDRLTAKTQLTTLDEDTFDACWEELEEAQHNLSMLNVSRSFVGMLREMVETIAVTEGTPLGYIKSY